MLKSLTNSFAKMRQGHENYIHDKRLAKIIAAAISTKDSDTIRTAFKQIRDPEAFIAGYDAVDERRYAYLLIQAIKSGAEDVFRAVYEFLDNPNYAIVIGKKPGFRGSVDSIFTSPLNYAIHNGQRLIAEIIARGSGLDLAKEYGYETPYDILMQLSRSDKTMDRVLSIVSERLAEQKMKEARVYRMASLI